MSISVLVEKIFPTISFACIVGYRIIWISVKDGYLLALGELIYIGHISLAVTSPFLHKSAINYDLNYDGISCTKSNLQFCVVIAKGRLKELAYLCREQKSQK